VWVDDRVVARKDNQHGFPTEDEVVHAVREALATPS
jgi:hypothetical protein